MGSIVERIERLLGIKRREDWDQIFAERETRTKTQIEQLSNLPLCEAEKELGITEEDVSKDSGYYKEEPLESPEDRKKRRETVDKFLSRFSDPGSE